MTTSYVAVDLETTGIGTKREKITEIGMVKVVLEKNPQSIKAVIDATDPNRVYYRPEN